MGNTTSLFHVTGQAQSVQRCDAVDWRLMIPTKHARDIDVHRHDDAHCILVLRGAYQTGAWRRQDVKRAEPQLIFNPPRTEHVDSFAPGQRLQDALFVSLTLTPGFWMQVCSSTDVPVVPEVMQGASVTALAALWMNADRGLLQEPSWLESSVIDVLEVFSGRMAAAKDSAKLAARIRLRLQAEVLDGTGAVQLMGIAAEFGIHPVYMARIFKKYWGYGPGEYVRALQLDKAVSLLRHSPMSIARIAQECNYHDHAHLTRMFHAAYGIAPVNYRKGRRLV